MSSFLCHRSTIPDLNRAELAKRADRLAPDPCGAWLTPRLREIFNRHHYVPVFERDVGGGAEFERHPARSDFFDREMNGPRSDFKLKRQADLAKPRIHLPDPVLETFRIERAHIPGENEVNEIANGFALFLRARMQLDHAADSSRSGTGPGG